MKIEGLPDEQDIVWYRDASYVDGNGQLQVLCRYLTRQERDALLEQFGQQWLDEYLREAELALERFSERGIH